MPLTPFLAIIRKDVQLFFSDRRAVIMAFVMPIAIGSFFGMLFSGRPSGDEVTKIPVLLVDSDNSTISKSIVVSISSLPDVPVTPCHCCNPGTITLAATPCRPGSDVRS